jgi:hypothetical protein
MSGVSSATTLATGFSNVALLAAKQAIEARREEVAELKSDGDHEEALEVQETVESLTSQAAQLGIALATGDTDKVASVVSSIVGEVGSSEVLKAHEKTKAVEGGNCGTVDIEDLGSAKGGCTTCAASTVCVSTFGLDTPTLDGGAESKK